jgi:hypothetical protein
VALFTELQLAWKPRCRWPAAVCIGLRLHVMNCRAGLGKRVEVSGFLLIEINQ